MQLQQEQEVMMMMMVIGAGMERKTQEKRYAAAAGEEEEGRKAKGKQRNTDKTTQSPDKRWVKPAREKGSWNTLGQNGQYREGI